MKKRKLILLCLITLLSFSFQSPVVATAHTNLSVKVQKKHRKKPNFFQRLLLKRLTKSIKKQRTQSTKNGLIIFLLSLATLFIGAGSALLILLAYSGSVSVGFSILYGFLSIIAGIGTWFLGRNVLRNTSRWNPSRWLALLGIALGSIGIWVVFEPIAEFLEFFM